MAKDAAATAKKKMTKAQTVAELATKTGLSKKQIGDVFDALRDTLKRELGKRGTGQFEVPGIVRLKIREQEARKGVKFRNPATGEVVVRDVPKSRKLRSTPVKALKDLVL
ncbi:MAG: HU family DNA-binding protein [Deltaproteobacteria bacterium]|nr:HU family DNA-binding protein [Deltaproteobacteria bacterium]